MVLFRFLPRRPPRRQPHGNGRPRGPQPCGNSNGSSIEKKRATGVRAVLSQLHLTPRDNGSPVRRRSNAQSNESMPARWLTEWVSSARSGAMSSQVLMTWPLYLIGQRHFADSDTPQLLKLIRLRSPPSLLGGTRDSALAAPDQTLLRFLALPPPPPRAAGAAAGQGSDFPGLVVVHNHRSTDTRSAGAEVIALSCVTSLLPYKLALSN